MGLLDDYEVDFDEVEAPSYEVPDNVYEFTVGEVWKREGTDNHPDKVWINIKYLLTDETDRARTYTEWLEIPGHQPPFEEWEKQKLGYFKARLLALGVPEEDLNSVSNDDLVGIHGSFQLKTTTNKKGSFQNIRNMRVDEEDDEPAAAPVVVKATRTRKPAAAPKAAPKAQVVKPEPVEESVWDEPAADSVEGAESSEVETTDDEQEESVEDIKARIAAKRAARAQGAGGARPNPFKK